MPLYIYQLGGYALLQRSTQKTGYGLINSGALVSSTGEYVPYNAWLTIAGPTKENYCAFNLAI